MKIETFYSHLNGYEWLQIRRPGFWKEIESTIESVDADLCRTKVSKEKGMIGKLLFNPAAMNLKF